MDQVKQLWNQVLERLDIPGLNYRVHLYEEAFSKSRVYFRFRNSFNGQL
jgi:hypothetical protein